MIDRIKAIIEREVERLDLLSKASGLELDDIRALELLGKVQRSFDKPLRPAEEEQPQPTPKTSTAALLEGLVDDE